MSGVIHVGDVLEELAFLEDGEVNSCITSPPYFGLRDYGEDGQIGLEKSPEDYVGKMVQVFREVRRVLRDDGTAWLNLGDSYARNPAKGQHKIGDMGKQAYIYEGGNGRASSTYSGAGVKEKDMLGIPWRVAFALQADGWYLRNDIIWAKPNPMPSSVTDRFTSSYEHVFLLAKRPKYFFDQKAVMEPSVTADLRRPYGSKGMWDVDGRPETQIHGGRMRKQDAAGNATYVGFNARWKGRGGKNAFRGQGHERASNGGPANRDGRCMSDVGAGPMRNRRDVWMIAPKPFKGAHFATFPPALIEPMVKAGCPKGGVVLDPFFGAGTTGLVAESLGRNWIGCELNPDYAAMARRRILDAYPTTKVGMA